MLLVYVQKITPRVSYTFKQICKRILGLEVDFTSKIEAFIAHDGPKLSYGKQPLGKELYFQSVDLLFEHGFNEVEIQVLPWEETQCFFQVKHPDTALPFDIFAATFYLLTRYEEYLPHVKDELGRFTATESVAYIYGFLEEPVVDIWSYKFKKTLEEKYTDIVFQEKKFSVKPIIQISQTFAYWQKGILRSLGGGLRDLWQLKLNEVMDRIKVVIGVKKDPYDTFDFIIDLQKNKTRNCIMFFGLGDYTNYEKNINHSNQKHKEVIKHVSDYIDVGLKISYEAISDLAILKKEKTRIENIVNSQLRYSLCAFYKIKLPEAYRNFIELEIKEDFSMGYPDHSGFRAGTCTPFMFYDLDYEVQTPLIIHSFCCAPNSFGTDENEYSVKKELHSYLEKIRKVNGVFTPVFSNGLFSELNEQTFWKSIFEFTWNKDENGKN
ncbi:polysaccharide deacetylase family protein [Aquimarina sp. 2201CG14-23]|uniref:polysaccharide deacetylase family protein n=1 Tax=Aquimarina mycalae TaxID=3040073 RepID=UPI0024780993|nr:polysaccharide deacetylase family protein [Aquimarina sp. 2201CG14-23]MDH7444790.1 polysaccharide deacetylase family protein [Aquimarina sp. 2201CG14-23]